MKPYYRVYSDVSTAAEHAITLEDAQARAEELAAKHPGRCFEILRCVGVASTSKASTFWMDGEGPPEKPRYRFLDPDEEVLPGDQYSSDGFAWHDVPGAGYYIDEFCSTHRRPL